MVSTYLYPFIQPEYEAACAAVEGLKKAGWANVKLALYGANGEALFNEEYDEFEEGWQQFKENVVILKRSPKILILVSIAIFTLFPNRKTNLKLELSI